MIQRYNNECSLITNSETPFFSINAFEQLDFLKSGFSTRLGGVSKGFTKSLNLGFDLEENRENVLENYKRITSAIRISPEQLVFTKQVHETNVLVVDKNDCGKGIFRERDYSSADGLVTNVPEVALTVFGADCVPLMFVDAKERIIGTAHAGWRGTVNNIAANVVNIFTNDFFSKTENIQVVIGPSICQNCYEVGLDVAQQFMDVYDGADTTKINVPDDYLSGFVLKAGEKDKFYLNLWLANYINLINTGIKTENIHLSGLCTMCRQDLFFSHRGSKGRRGVMCGFIMIDN